MLNILVNFNPAVFYLGSKNVDKGKKNVAKYVGCFPKLNMSGKIDKIIIKFLFWN